MRWDIFPQPEINQLNLLSFYFSGHNLISLVIKNGPVFLTLHRTEDLLTCHGGQVFTLFEPELFQMFHTTHFSEGVSHLIFSAFRERKKREFWKKSEIDFAKENPMRASLSSLSTAPWLSDWSVGSSLARWRMFPMTWCLAGRLSRWLASWPESQRPRAGTGTGDTDRESQARIVPPSSNM